MSSKGPFVAAAAVVVLVLGAVLFVRMRRTIPRPRSAPSAAFSTASAASNATASASSPFAPGEEPSQQQLVRDIDTEGLTPERAKWYFALEFGSFPGLTVPASVKRDPTDFDGTPAALDIASVWNALTNAEKDAVMAILEPDMQRAPRQSRLELAPLFSIRPAAFLVEDTPAFDYGALQKMANEKLSMLLQVPPIPTVTFDVDYGTPGIAYGYTSSWWKNPIDEKQFKRPQWAPFIGGCHTTYWNQKFAPLDTINAAAVVVHEMFHCYQDVKAGNLAARVSVKDWINEGEATWAMASAIPAGYAVVQPVWMSYNYGPGTAYMDRGYDGVGVFGHLSDLIGEDVLWKKLLDVFAAGEGKNDKGAFSLLIQGNEEQYLSSWGASYFIDTVHAPTWDIKGPGSPPTNGSPPSNVSISSGTLTSIMAGPYNANASIVDGSADIVELSLMSGYARVHDAGFGIDTEITSAGELGLCMKDGGCTCPDGTPGASLITKPAKFPISVGLEGGDQVGQISVLGASLEDFCKQDKNTKKPPQPPIPPGGPGGGGPGGGNPPKQPAPPAPGVSWGDPHLSTFDGLAYDFQVVGEYTLARSTTDDLLVQVRQVPVLGSKAASVNKAVAMRVSGQRISVEIENNEEVLRIDGTPVRGALPRLRAGSITSSLSVYGTSYQVTWPDGTTVRVEPLGGAALNVSMTPATARRGALVGLLGNDDEMGGNDLADDRGVPLGAHPSGDAITHVLAGAWRVKPGESLFDYLPGQSAATFADPLFPDPAAPKIANTGAAEQACRAQGITDRQLLDDCIYDFAVTNNFLFDSKYAYAQHVANATAVTMPAAATAKRPLLFEGTIASKTDQQQIQFTASAGDVVWIGQPNCNDATGQVFGALIPPGAPVKSGAMPACFFGRQVLKTTGTYTMVATMSWAANQAPPLTYAIPIIFIRADRHRDAAYGDFIIGTIDSTAAHDYFSFAAAAGDVIRVSGQGCDLQRVYVRIVSPDGSAVGGPVCRDGTDVQVSKTGTYQLEVNPNDTGPGSYRFVLQGAPGTLQRPR